MKNTIKNLINQVKKAISGKCALPLSEKAYANNNGDLIARTFKDNAEIIVFVGGIVEDITKREAIYTKDNLTVAADTGIFNGGKFLKDMESPDTVSTFYDLPEADFTHAVTIPADDLKAAATTTSKDNTRPILCNIHFTVSGMIESCDGFRAYRKQGNALNPAALDKFESVDGLLLPYPATAYGLKGDVKIYNSNKYLKLEDAAGLILYVRKPNQANYLNMEKVYEGYNRDGKTAAIVTIKDKKSFLSVIKNSISTERRQGLWLRVRNGFIDYLSDKLDTFGSIEAETSNATPEDFYIKLNPRYLYDALANQDGIKIYFPNTQHAPIFIVDAGEKVNALLLPIREDKNSPFWHYDKQLREAAEKKQQPTPAADPEKKFLEVPEALTPSDFTADEKEALKRINDRQNAANRFENITREDVKAEAEKQEAAAPVEKLEIVKREEITPPEIVKARRFYSQMKSCHFKPTAIQEAEAETIYKLNREQLQPIARQAGNLYIDTLSIIAAIMSVYDN
ncbi:MAG: hypothetical protein IKH75_11770 [Ruminococcus sp.]|nr:hypothetical protein [Ruminococcus sp.]